MTNNSDNIQTELLDSNSLLNWRTPEYLARLYSGN